MNQEQLNNLSGKILDACICVHKELGPGLLESAYAIALSKELSLRQISCLREVPIELLYKGVSLGKTYYIDILVENSIILELKSVETIHPIYEAQLITYLRLSNLKLGFLVNFNVTLLKYGFKRMVNNF
jgi:GxxExxY protein